MERYSPFTPSTSHRYSKRISVNFNGCSPGVASLFVVACCCCVMMVSTTVAVVQIGGQRQRTMTTSLSWQTSIDHVPRTPVNYYHMRYGKPQKGGHLTIGRKFRPKYSRTRVAVTAAPPVTKTRPKSVAKMDSKQKKGGGNRAYVLLLHNDDINKKDYVVNVLTSVVPDLDSAKALEIMEEAHSEGKAPVRKCDETEARELCAKLRENGLTATVEPNMNE